MLPKYKIATYFVNSFLTNIVFPKTFVKLLLKFDILNTTTNINTNPLNK